jgi:hypothetical protein
MRMSFVYLATAMDWSAGFWQPSNAMDLSFSIDAAEEALQHTAVCKSSTPVTIAIHDCSAEFTSLLTTNGISVGVDGKGAWRDDVCLERFWRAIKDAQAYRAPIKAPAKHGNRSVVISRSMTQNDLPNRCRPHPRSSPLQPAAAQRACTGDPLSDAEAFVQRPGPQTELHGKCSGVGEAAALRSTRCRGQHRGRNKGGRTSTA